MTSFFLFSLMLVVMAEAPMSVAPYSLHLSEGSLIALLALEISWVRLG
jgi:hypothetical protein